MILGLEYIRFYELRQKLFNMIKESLDEDGHCKHYEGELHIEIIFPNYFATKKEEPTYCIHLDCYLIGPSRHYDWYGKTLTECLDKFERALCNPEISKYWGDYNG